MLGHHGDGDRQNHRIPGVLFGFRVPAATVPVGDTIVDEAVGLELDSAGNGLLSRRLEIIPQ